MSNSLCKAVLFDLDGTLVDSAPDLSSPGVAELHHAFHAQESIGGQALIARSRETLADAEDHLARQQLQGSPSSETREVRRLS